MHDIGSKMLEGLLNSDNGGYKGRELGCEAGHNFEFIDYRDKNLVTVLVSIKVKRAYYYDKECKKGYCPKDKELDIPDTSFSPGVRRMMGRVGAYRAFGLGHEDIKEMAGINIGRKEIERCSNDLGIQVEKFYSEEVSKALSPKVISLKKIPIMYICIDGTGVPVVKKETANRKGKGEDGNAKTREVKLGCVFTQSTVDEKGHPVRDEGSTSYVGAIETAEEFSKRIYSEAVRRGLNRAEEVCILGDGAAWIWNIAEEQFYGSTQIVDLYHAREHYWKVAKIAFSNKEKRDQWAFDQKEALNKGDVTQVINAIQELSAQTQEDQNELEKAIGYFSNHQKKMKYNEFKEKVFFVGSGVLEAGCRSIIGQRLKQSGMHWTVKGANNIISLRTCFFSNRWEDFWEFRATG